MKGKRYTEEQIIGILKEHEAGMAAQDVIRKHGIGERHVLPLEVEVWRYGGVGSQAIA